MDYDDIKIVCMALLEATTLQENFWNEELISKGEYLAERFINQQEVITIE